MQTLPQLFSYSLTFQLFFFISSTCALSCTTLTKNGSNFVQTITVSNQVGKGNFVNVQDAVDFIPSGNNKWIRIYVHSGSYWEQVHIPYDKQCIVLEGEGPTNTKIVYNGHTSTDTSSTFVSSADNFVAKNICFMNAYNNRGKGKVPMGEVKQAVAASVYGDKSAFYNCWFVGYQDTLWLAFGRHFFKSCYIEGAVDFIWGNGQSFFEDCNINVRGNGFITAQSRGSEDDTSGFVFKRGTISGSGQTYLGRALAAYSRVIFQYTQLSHVINPLGWDARHLVGHENTLTYAEIKCTGEGSNMSRRVSWEKTIDKQSELSKYTRHLFIDKDNWINQQP